MPKTEFPARDYDLAATLTSGQAFRWKSIACKEPKRASTSFGVPPSGGSPGRVNAELQTSMAWESVIRGRWVRLRQRGSIIEATTAEPQTDWQWLTDYLRLADDHVTALASFPDDEPMRAATKHCHGLRLLRQEPWECLASFILSSTKQIVQIQQCVALLCQRYGIPLPSATDPRLHFSFPTPTRIAAANEAELRECKMGFRAKYLLDAARHVTSGQLNLAALPTLPLDDARAALMECHGVGRKIADCVLLFSLGFDEAFPIDVWVERALQQLYFPKRRVKRARLERFATTHFGPHSGLAQQYLFHYLRTGDVRSRRDNGAEMRGKRQTSASSRRRLQPETKS